MKQSVVRRTIPVRKRWTKPWVLYVVTALLLVLRLVSVPATSTAAQSPARSPSAPEKVILFASDGMRQDLAEAYVHRGLMPAIAKLLSSGAKAADGGLITQAPSNTGSGWYSLSTGAWPGVHGSTNNTFHINGAAFNGQTGSFNEGVLQAETLAQATERGGRKVAQIEWPGGRVGIINGPTVDFRSTFSRPGVATTYIGPTDNAARVASFDVQFDHPAGFAGQAPFPGASPVDAGGWLNVPPSSSPAKEMRLRVIESGADKYGLNAYLFDSTDDGVTNYDRVLFSPTRNGANAVATLGRGQWGDVKVRIVDGPLKGKTAGMLIKVEELTGDLSRVRLYHTSVSRANAGWVGWSAPGFAEDFAEYAAQQFPTSTAADFAVLEAGIVCEETYVEQGLAWEAAYHPLIKYIVETYQPDLVMVGYPATDEFQHQFLGLITPVLPNGAPNPSYDDHHVNGTPDGRVTHRTAFIQRAYQGADATLALVQSLMPAPVSTFVTSDHDFAPQFLSIDASKVLVEMGLLSRPQTANCLPAAGETIGKAKACWAGGTLQIYLNLAGRDPAGGGLQQVPADQEGAAVAKLKAAFMALKDPNDWTGDGRPEGWRMIDRAYTKAEARYIPNGPGSTADMAHPTRTGDLVVFSCPPYQYDLAGGALVGRSSFFGQHGYLPDMQNLAAAVNMRALFIAGGGSIRPNTVAPGLRIIDLAPTIAYLLRIPQPQHTQGHVRLDLVRGGETRTLVTVIGLTDYHGQLDPTAATMDGRMVSVGGAAYLATMFDEDAAQQAGPSFLFASGDSVGASPSNSALLDDMPTIDVENAWRLDAASYGNHEFDYGIERLLRQQARATFPILGANIVDAATLKNPPWVRGTHVVTFGDRRIGVIGIALGNTPEMVKAGSTASLKFLPAVAAIRTESERLRRMGIPLQIVLIHEGTAVGQNALDGNSLIPWQGPVIPIAQAVQDTTVDVILGGHTHRVTNLMVGTILVAEGPNAGAGYTVVQMVVRGDDVEWAGAATRIAKNLGVPKRPDVQAIVDNANARTALLNNQVVGMQLFDIKRAPTRLFESAMGNMITDAMRLQYPGVDAAYTNSGGLRADLNCEPPDAGERPCEITRGEMFAVLPFGNRTVIVTLTGAQLEQAFLNGFAPKCNPAVSSGRFPQISGLKVTYACNGTTPVVTGMWKAVAGIGGKLIPIGPTDTVRLVTSDFMLTGGDGYRIFTQGTHVLQPGDDMLQVCIDYVAARSPVSPLVEGRIVGP